MPSRAIATASGSSEKLFSFQGLMKQMKNMVNGVHDVEELHGLGGNMGFYVAVGANCLALFRSSTKADH